jgi:hypothetical protein
LQRGVVTPDIHEQLRSQQLHLRQIGLGGDHMIETFYRLLRPIHCSERHAAAIPGLD